MIVIDGVEMVGVREAARLAGRTPETVRRWVWSGRVVARKEGNRLLVPRSDIEAMGSGRADDGAEEPLTLGEWARRVADSRHGEPGASAADLVIADRAGR